MTRTRPKYHKRPRGIADSTLSALWRKAVLAHYGYHCVICGGYANDGGWPLEAHHVIKRRYKLLKWDWRNGVPVHVGDCHSQADKMGVGVVPAQADYLMKISKWTKKDYLFGSALSETEWRGRVKAALLAELAAAGGAQEGIWTVWL